MSPLDDLPADQRAVLQLVLRQGRSYADIATALRLDEDAVRGRAHQGLDALGPATAVSPAARAAAADWLLGQQDDAAAAATEADLAADADARAWTAALRDRLAPLAARELTAVPEPSAFAAADPAPALAAGAAVAAAPVASPAAAAAAAEAEAVAGEQGGSGDDRRDPSPTRPRTSRRGGAFLLGVVGLLAVVVLIVALTRSGGSDSGTQATTTPTMTGASSGGQNAGKILAQVNLRPPHGAPNRKALGVVQLALVNGHQSLTAIAQGLKVTKGSSWGIWAEGGPGGRRWLGPFSQGDAQGRVYAQGRLEPDMDVMRYRRLVISRDAAKTPPASQGTVYLTGAIKAPKQQGG
jgi:hypothetical protein